MKCKAKWIKGLRTWQLHCSQCDIWTMYTHPDNLTPIAPHDMARKHAERYHSKGV